MKPTVPARLFRRHRIFSWVLISILVFVVGLLSSSLITANMLTQARYVRKMESLARVVANALQDYIRTNSIYPAQLRDFRFDDQRVFTALGVKPTDVQKLKYYTDGSSFRLTYETTDFRFILVGDKMKGVSLFEPTTRKSDS